MITVPATEPGTSEPIAEAVVVRPGDTLIVRLHPRVTRVEADELDERLRRRLDGVEVILVGGAEQFVVHRPVVELAD